MALTQKTEHFHDVLPNLAAPFWGKPRVAALIRAFVNRIQELEDAAWSVLNGFYIDNAEGVNLDVLGRVVGQERLGFTDDQYRLVLRGRIGALKSRGLAEDLISVFNLATGLSTGAFVRDLGNALLKMEAVSALTAEQAVATMFLLPKARAGGVQLRYYYFPSDAETTEPDVSGIAFADVVDPVTTPGEAFSHVRRL